MSSRVNRVVYVETTKSMVQLRDAYSQLGQILSISPWETRAHRTQLNCFIEFADKRAVEHAATVGLPDTKLHIVAYSPQLTAHFLSIAQPLFLPSPPPSMTDIATVKQEARASRWPPKRMTNCEIASSTESTPKKRRREENNFDVEAIAHASAAKLLEPTGGARRSSSGPRSDKENHTQAVMEHASTSRPILSLPRRQADLFPESPMPTLKDAHAAAAASSDLDHRTLPVQLDSLSNDSSGAPRNSIAPEAFTNTLGQTVTSVASSIITLTYNGEPVSCDLHRLEEDPRKIIAVLRATARHASERDKWMLVAAQYRSRGNFESAVAVLDAMVEAMLSPPVLLAATDLKPAYLMLSSCHRDLAAHSSSEDSAIHARRATECLQQVYGIDVPRTQVTSEFAQARARTCMDIQALISSAPTAPEPNILRDRECLANASNLLSQGPPTEPRAIKQEDEDAVTPVQVRVRDCDNASSHLHHGSCHNHRDRERSTPGSRSLSRSQRDKRVQSLEREIRMLRDRAAENVTALHNTRSARRKLEDELIAERAARRRMEDAVEAASGDLSRARDELVRTREEAARVREELSRARRGETSALEQAAAEVASRRAAEARAEALKEEVGRLRGEIGRTRADCRGAVEEGRKAEQRAREVFTRLGASFSRVGRGELPLGFVSGLDTDGPGTGGTRMGGMPVEAVDGARARSRSVSTSGRGWVPGVGIGGESR